MIPDETVRERFFRGLSACRRAHHESSQWHRPASGTATQGDGRCDDTFFRGGKGTATGAANLSGGYAGYDRWTSPNGGEGYADTEKGELV